MVLRLPGLVESLLDTPKRGRCHHIGGHEALLGLDENDCYRTKVKKTYPPGMSKLIAEATVAAIRGSWTPPASSDDNHHSVGYADATNKLDGLPEELQKFYVPFDPYSAEGHITVQEALAKQSDFHWSLASEHVAWR